MTSDARLREASASRGPDARGIFSARYLWVTIGTCALVFLSAFESLAVTTIMPLVSADLDGAELYALAFAGPLASGVVGMVVAGNWSDRNGPIAPLITSVAVFIAGLLIAGTATDMAMLVAGRLVQGLGSGAMNVALYVVVARIYPPDLHAKIFAGFAAAWVIPSLIGPFAAGVVAELTSWHWVFLGVVGLVLLAMLMVVPALRMLSGGPRIVNRPRWAVQPIVWAVLAALAVLGLNLSVQLDGPFVWLGALTAVAVALFAVRTLVPSGTLPAARGLPTVILVRGLIAAAFFGAEVYIPYLLTERYAFSPAFAGLALTGAALTWAGASWLQGRLGDALTHPRAMGIGSVLVLFSILAALVTTAAALSPAILIVGWLFGGAGMGLMYPRLSVLTLAYSSERDQGFNSSALSISDSLGGALALASTGIVFASLLGIGGVWPFAGCFALAALVGCGAVAIGSRVGDGRRVGASSGR